MKKIGLIAAAFCLVCLIRPLKGREILPGMAQDGQRLTPEEAIDTARHNSKAGSSFTILREIVANADTRHIGDQALEQARAHQIELYRNGMLADLLRSGGFLLAETEPRTNNVIALHLLTLGPDGVPKDAFDPCRGAIKLADAEELVKETTEFAEQLYSTPSTQTLSLEGRFYGGSFPECGPSEECTLFSVPRSLLKLGVAQKEYQEAAALYGGLAIWQFRYAVSMTAFAASPLAATQAAENPVLEFLRNNHMDPDFHFDLENIRSEEQLRQRIDVLRRLDKFLEEALRNKVDPDLVKANISVATIPLAVDGDTRNGQVLYSSSMASLIVIYWRRLPKGGFAVHLISEAG
jgi:hypothetical protein